MHRVDPKIDMIRRDSWPIYCVETQFKEDMFWKSYRWKTELIDLPGQKKDGFALICTHFVYESTNRKNSIKAVIRGEAFYNGCICTQWWLEASCIDKSTPFQMKRFGRVVRHQVDRDILELLKTRWLGITIHCKCDMTLVPYTYTCSPHKISFVYFNHLFSLKTIKKQIGFAVCKLVDAVRDVKTIELDHATVQMKTPYWLDLW